MPLDPATLTRLRALRLDPVELEFSFARSGGPGGQHVNKVETAVTVRHAPSQVAVTASDSRSQATNRELALARLLDKLEARRREAAQARRAEASAERARRNRRSEGQKRRMIEQKRRRGETKQHRRRPEE